MSPSTSPTAAVAGAVSQAVAVATGLQEKFSWKSVALSALTAGLTQGVGGGTLIKGAGSFVNDALHGALINAGTQGIRWRRGFRTSSTGPASRRRRRSPA